jgi:hypothetical protein
MPEPKELSLTDLAAANIRLARELQQHTAGRNYLWLIANNEAPPPIMTIQPYFPTDDIADQQVTIDFNTVSNEARESIILTALQHEEALAFDVWAQIAKNATNAMTVIANLQKVRAEALQPPDDSTESPVHTLQFPGTATYPEDTP